MESAGARGTGVTDAALLDAVLDSDRLDQDERHAFSNMRANLTTYGKLTPKQRAWLDRVAERLDVAEPSRNLVSAGLVPRGREVPLPDVLRPENLPKRPPRAP